MLFANHPSEEDLELFVLNRLPAEKTPGIEEHLLLCPECIHTCSTLHDWTRCLRQSLNQLQTQDMVPTRAPAMVVTAERLTRNWRSAVRWCSYATAAALLLMAILAPDTVRRGHESPMVATRTSPGLWAQWEEHVSPLDEIAKGGIVSTPVRRARAGKVRRSPTPNVRIVKTLRLPAPVVACREPELMDAPADLVIPGGDNDVLADALLDAVPDTYMEPKRPSILRRFFAAIVKTFRNKS
jgi:hypothetical protein